MSEPGPEGIDKAINAGDRPGTQRWVLRGVAILVALVLAFILYQIAASFLPRWWAQRVRGQVDGSFTAGTLWGLFYGFLFTFVPAVVLFQARRKLFRWKAKLVVVALALVLAAPNWLTLTVVAGNSKAAHAGERILDVDAPGFRAATLIGVIVGAVIAIVLSSTSMMLTHRRRQVKELKEQAKHSKDPDATDS